jgi:hypothetical protein
MPRVLLTVIVPLLLPTALYILWAITLGRGASAEEKDRRAVPWIWLTAAGLVLALAVPLAVVQIGGARQGTYVAPHLENGEIVPGHIEPAH